jgi:hypothetical protein
MLYDYDEIIDVKDAVGACDPYDPFKIECCDVTLTGFKSGLTYYFAATAYDEDDNESAYSEELSHTFIDVTPPGQPGNLNLKDALQLIIPDMERSMSMQSMSMLAVPESKKSVRQLVFAPTVKSKKQLIIEAIKEDMQ